MSMTIGIKVARRLGGGKVQVILVPTVSCAFYRTQIITVVKPGSGMGESLSIMRLVTIFELLDPQVGVPAENLFIEGAFDSSEIHSLKAELGWESMNELAKREGIDFWVGFNTVTIDQRGGGYVVSTEE